MGHVKKANFSLAYERIRKTALPGQSTVLFFVAADVDAICAFRILATLFKSDSISYVVVPVGNMDDVKNEAKSISRSIRSVIMLNCGALFNMEDYIELHEDITVYVFDSHRPVDLRNCFWHNEVIVAHDTDLDRELQQEKDALIFTEENEYEPDADGGRRSPADDEDDLEGDDDDDDDDEDGYGQGRRQRRRTGLDTEVVPGEKNREWEAASETIVQYMSQGLTFGNSISNQCYTIASQLDRVSGHILWLAIVGLTSMYTNEQISHEQYLEKVQLYKDESERLFPAPASRSALSRDIPSVSTPLEEGKIQCTDEYRFVMVRHWSLYEAMYHSHYVASRLGIWRERGRRRLLALLAKMGFSLQESHQVYTHMDINLKRILKEKIESVAPEYGMHEILFTSFLRSRGFQGAMSASDFAYAASALLEVSPEASICLGIKADEHLGLDLAGSSSAASAFSTNPLMTANGTGPPSGSTAASTLAGANGPSRSTATARGSAANGSGDAQDSDSSGASTQPAWWHANFYKACDALSESAHHLEEGVVLAMKLRRAIIRQGVAIIDKQLIKTLSNYRLTTVKDGPDLPVFWNPSAIQQLAQFLVYAIREYGSSKSSSRPIPLVLAVLNEPSQTYYIAGVNGSSNIGEVISNKFGTAFQRISMLEGIPVRYVGYDHTVIEIDRDDFEGFLSHIGRYLKKK
ncbi:hypothetical protein DFQ26_006365 [Actinomortierella ambigua]|nr:hypothetical protein DFQ26_006365 [Actinomortierella ambigua]